MSAGRDRPAELTFEQAFARLEAIVEQLEGGALSLEASLKLFEEACALRAKCEELLQRAEAAIRKVSTDEQGQMTEEPFEVGSENDDQRT